jgi:hypothetical protein
VNLLASFLVKKPQMGIRGRFPGVMKIIHVWHLHSVMHPKSSLYVFHAVFNLLNVVDLLEHFMNSGQ